MLSRHLEQLRYVWSLRCMLIHSQFLDRFDIHSTWGYWWDCQIRGCHCIGFERKGCGSVGNDQNISEVSILFVFSFVFIILQTLIALYINLVHEGFTLVNEITSTEAKVNITMTDLFDMTTGIMLSANDAEMHFTFVHYLITSSF